MYIGAHDHEHVESVMVKGFWYSVTPGTFKFSPATDELCPPSFEFQYQPRRFGDPPRTMHVNVDKVEAVQIAGDK
jgi:hypothetical protein